MTLIQIRAFLAVVQYGGFTAAAKALSTSQTTITSQIQAIEQEYAVQLFHRRGRRVDLSSVGLEFLTIARQIASLEGDASSLLRDSGELVHGTLKIGAVGPYHIIDMIEAYHELRPAMNLSVTLGNSEDVLRDLDNYVCDVGVLAVCDVGAIASALENEHFYMQPYARYPVIACVNAAHPLAQRDEIDLRELAEVPLLMREQGSTTRRALEDALDKIGLKARISMEIGSREALRESIARGLGVGTMSESEYIPDGRLHKVRIKGNPITTHIHVCCLRERQGTQLVTSFFEAVGRCQPAS